MYTKAETEALLPTVITATINSDVTVARSNTAGVGVNRDGGLSTGDYVVTTPADISQCTYVATLGAPAARTGPDAGQITVRPSTSGPANVYIQTSDETGVLTDLSFHIVIYC